jgi:hypothetical protein
MDITEIMKIVAENHGQSVMELEAEIEAIYQVDNQNTDVSAEQFLKALTIRILNGMR